MWRITGTGAGESFTAARRSRLRVTWGHPNLTGLPELITGFRRDSSHVCSFCLSFGNSSLGPGTGLGTRHRYHQVMLLVPQEVVLPAILNALYIVSRLILTKAPEGTLTLPILQMRKQPQGSLSNLPKVTRLVSGRAALLVCFIYRTVSTSGSGLRVVHLGKGSA